MYLPFISVDIVLLVLQHPQYCYSHFMYHYSKLRAFIYLGFVLYYSIFFCHLLKPSEMR